MRLKRDGGRALRPPAEPPFGKAFLRQPEPLSVIDQDLERGCAAAAEQEHAAGKRIGGQFLAAQLGERIDAFASIHCLDGYQV